MKNKDFTASENEIFHLWEIFYTNLNIIIKDALHNWTKIYITQNWYTSAWYSSDKDNFQASYVLKFDTLSATYQNQINWLRDDLLAWLYLLEVDNITNIIKDYSWYVKSRDEDHEKSRKFFEDHIKSENVSLGEREPLPSLEDFQNFINPYYKTSINDVEKIWNELTALRWASFWMNDFSTNEKEIHDYISWKKVVFVEYFIEQVYVFNKDFEEHYDDSDFPDIEWPDLLNKMKTIYLSSPYDTISILNHFDNELKNNYWLDLNLSSTETFIKQTISFN